MVLSLGWFVTLRLQRLLEPEAKSLREVWLVTCDSAEAAVFRLSKVESVGCQSASPCLENVSRISCHNWDLLVFVLYRRKMVDPTLLAVLFVLLWLPRCPGIAASCVCPCEDVSRSSPSTNPESDYDVACVISMKEIGMYTQEQPLLSICWLLSPVS